MMIKPESDPGHLSFDEKNAKSLLYVPCLSTAYGESAHQVPDCCFLWPCLPTSCSFLPLPSWVGVAGFQLFPEHPGALS